MGERQRESERARASKREIDRQVNRMRQDETEGGRKREASSVANETR